MIKYYTGAIKSPKDLRNYHIAKSSKMVDLSTSFELMHSHIKNQGNVNSCVAHSLSEILETKDGINYSTGWIYGYRPNEYYQGEGMVVADALKTIKNVGYITSKDLDVNIEMSKAKELVDKDLSKYKSIASNNKIGSYARLYNTNEIKQAIYTSKTPVIIVIDIDDQGLKLDKDNVAYIPDNSIGLHAVVCYGWNEKGLLIQNSWGSKWGNKGTFILPYAYPIEEAWAIDLTPEEVEKPNYYWLRELIMEAIKFLRQLLEKCSYRN